MFLNFSTKYDDMRRHSTASSADMWKPFPCIDNVSDNDKETLHKKEDQ